MSRLKSRRILRGVDMNFFKLGANFSERPEVLKVEQKFGLSGMARMVKLVELLALSPSRLQGVISMPLSDWQEVMQCSQPLLMPLFVYLQQADWLSFEASSEPGAPLRVTLKDHAQYVVGPALFDLPAQWADWFVLELAATEQLVGAPETLIIFKRWCATNVTTNEVEAAVELAIKARQAPTPGVLHEHLKTVRKLKIEKALS